MQTSKTKLKFRAAPALMVLAFLAYGCESLPPIERVEHLDIERFMGDWRVIASIPTPFEKDVYNGIESYRRDPDGTIATTFTFNAGSMDGPEKTYRARGFVSDPSGAVWGMQFIWPFKAEYRVVYLDEDYTLTVIGRTKRDYVWIMAREPEVPEADYARILKLLEEQGYDIGQLVKVPHATRSGGG